MGRGCCSSVDAWRAPLWVDPHPWLEPVTAPDDRDEEGQAEHETLTGAAEGPDLDAEHAVTKPEERRRSRAISWRTLAVCTLVALVAALLAGIIAARTTRQASDTSSDAVLRDAEDLPEMALPTLDGEGEIDLARYRGMPLVVNFWGSWCQPCVREMPAFQRVHASLEPVLKGRAGEVADWLRSGRRME